MESTTNLKSDLEALKLPEKSKEQYKTTFDKFNQWCETQNVSKIEETVVVHYFKTLSKSYAPSSLWSFYSMLRTTINQAQKIDISRYTQLIPFLKENSKSFQQKKAKTFTRSEIARFLQDADDDKYLLIKVLTICGLFGALRREELMNMKYKHVRDTGDAIEVEVPCTSRRSRLFTIAKDSSTKVDVLAIFRKYIELRPKSNLLDRFFLVYRDGKCLNIPAGVNAISGGPKMIAEFLKLPHPEHYTGHSFRRTAMSLARESNCVQMTLDECRLCLLSVNVAVDLFAPDEDSKDLVKLIEKMTGTKIKDTWSWPRKICTDCLTTVNEYGKFCKKIKANQETIWKRYAARSMSPVLKQKLIATIEESAESTIITGETGDQTIESTMTFKEEPMDEDDDDEFDEYVITVSEEPQIKTEMPENINFEPNDEYVVTKPILEEPCVKIEPPILDLKPSTSKALKGSTKGRPKQKVDTDLKSKPSTTSSRQCQMCPKGKFSTTNELQEHIRKVHKNTEYLGILLPDQRTSNKYELVIQGTPKPNIDKRIRSFESSSCPEHQSQQQKMRLKITLEK